MEFWEPTYTKSDSGDMIEEKLLEITVFVKRIMKKFKVCKF